MDRIAAGLDLSFNNCGWVIIEARGDRHSIKASGIVRSYDLQIAKAEANWKSIVDTRKCEYMFNEIKDKVIFPMMMMSSKDMQPILAYEIPIGSQSARAAACLGMARGVLACLSKTFINEINNVDVYGSVAEILPKEVHSFAVGKDKASKDEMIEWACKKGFAGKADDENSVSNRYRVSEYRGAHLFSVYKKGDFEHIADAIAVALAALEGERKCKK